MRGEASLAVWAALAVEAIWARYARNERTAVTVAAEIRRLFRYLQAMGATRCEDVTCELVTRWFWAARPDRAGRMLDVSASTAGKRQWYALVCFEELARLGAPINPSALVGAAHRASRRADVGTASRATKSSSGPAIILTRSW